MMMQPCYLDLQHGQEMQQLQNSEALDRGVLRTSRCSSRRALLCVQGVSCTSEQRTSTSSSTRGFAALLGRGSGMCMLWRDNSRVPRLRSYRRRWWETSKRDLWSSQHSNVAQEPELPGRVSSSLPQLQPIYGLLRLLSSPRTGEGL